MSSAGERLWPCTAPSVRRDAAAVHTTIAASRCAGKFDGRPATSFQSPWMQGMYVGGLDSNQSGVFPGWAPDRDAHSKWYLPEGDLPASCLQAGLHAQDLSGLWAKKTVVCSSGERSVYVACGLCDQHSDSSISAPLRTQASSFPTTTQTGASGGTRCQTLRSAATCDQAAADVCDCTHTLEAAAVNTPHHNSLRCCGMRTPPELHCR